MTTSLFLDDHVILYPACQALSRIWTIPLPFLTLHFTTDDPERDQLHALHARHPSALFICSSHPFFYPIVQSKNFPLLHLPSKLSIITAQQNTTSDWHIRDNFHCSYCCHLIHSSTSTSSPSQCVSARKQSPKQNPRRITRSSPMRPSKSIPSSRRIG